MTNQPWECPRCHRMNAPWNPCCFCHPDDKAFDLDKRPEVMLPLEGDSELFKAIKEGISFPIRYDGSTRCSICNNFHEHGRSCATYRCE